MIPEEQLDLVMTGLNQMDEGITVFDKGLRLVAWNRAFLDFMELPEDMLRIGLPASELVRFNADRGMYGEGSADDQYTARMKLITLRQKYAEERTRPDGRIIEARQFPMGDGGLIMTYRDISDAKRAEKMARLTEERFWAYMEKSPNAAFIKDEEGRHVYINRQAAYLLDIPHEKIIGKTDAEFMDPDAAERFIAQDSEILETGESLTYEEMLIVEGEETHFIISKFLFSSPDGSRYVGGIATDATDLKRAEEALRLSREGLENAQRIARVGSWEWKIATNDLHWSDEVYRILGLDPEKFTPTDAAVINAVHAEDLDDVEAATVIAMKSGKPYEVDHRIVRPTGEVRYVRSRGEVERAADGSTGWMRGTVQDITDQWQAERKAGQEKARAQDYLRIAGSIIFSVGVDEKLMLLNRAGCRVLECEETEAVGQDWFESFIPADEREMRRKIFRQWMSGEQEISSEIESRVVSLKGNERYVRWQIAPLTGIDGELTGILSSGQDMTDQRRTEAQLRQAQKMEAVGQLTSGIAHDFNNMLAVVMGNLEMAAEAIPEGNRAKRYLSTAMAGAQRGADLNRQLLTFSRRQIFEESVCDVSNVLSNMIAIVQRTLGEDIKIETNFSDGECFSQFDPAQMESAVLNLALNARDAMPDGGTLTIETHIIRDDDNMGGIGPKDAQVHIMVGDTGAGMDPDVQERAIEPFFTTKDAGDGSGLGLSMVYGFVERSGGRITIESQAGQGCRIHLFLPAHEPQSAQKEGVGIAPGGGPVGAGTVLLVEDQAEVREVIKCYLEALGYQVLPATDARQALGAMEQSGDEIQVVLSDLILPGGRDGVDVLSAARRLVPGAKRVLMSGNLARSDQHKDGGLEGIPLLRKPFLKADLARVLGADPKGSGP